ncbi:MAG TPA: hypothetical protein VF508_09310, partial [Pyrinomonadaceae bacterium]
HVAGAAALLFAKKPDASAARVRSALMLSGDYSSYLGFNTVTGRRLNAAAALQNLDSADVTPPSAPTSLSASVGGREIRLSWNAPGDDGIQGRATLYEIRYSDADLTNPANFAAALKVGAPQPADVFTPENLTFYAFYGRSSVNVGIRALDEVGNAGPVTQLHLDLDPLAVDPYAVTESAAEPLSAGGTALGLVKDEGYKTVQLPFPFPFYGFTTSSLQVSANGTIYPVPSLYPPQFPADAEGFDFLNSSGFLTSNRVIAAAWDDLRTDARAGDDVYLVQPDADRVILRWQGVTFDTAFGDGTTRGENPVNFEVELRRDGTVVMRYGAGNQNMLPVVGLSAGEREPYLVASHTSEDSLKDLTGAQTVTFARRTRDNSPYADLRLTSMGADVNPAQTGKRVSYTFYLVNYGSLTPDVTVTDTLPPGTSFVSCQPPPFIGATCAGPPPGANGGTVTFNFPAYHLALTDALRVTVDVTAPAGSTLTNTATATSSARDPEPQNNTTAVTIPVAGGDSFVNARQVSARNYYTLALKDDGTVWGWGENKSGQVYDGSKDELRNLPVQVAGVSNATAIAAGSGFALALKGDGTVWGWGDNSMGQLGNADAPAAKSATVQVKGLSGVKAIAAGGSHALALKTDGTLWAWGANGGGQLNTGAWDDSPHYVPLFVASDVVALAAGPGQTYAVKSDGTVWVCGYNFYGLAGQPSTVSHIPTLTKMQGLSNVTAVFSGEKNSFAVRSDGTLWAWGDNEYGQFGAGRGAQTNPTPVQVPGLS